MTKRPFGDVTAAPVLLDDAAMRAFVVNGYHVVSPSTMALPTSFHTSLARKMEEGFADEDKRHETRESFNDSLLRRLPEMRQLFADGAVNGALTSILGRDWALHSHSYAHDRYPTTAVQREMIHKDGGFDGCYDGLVTRTRWALLLYYPQAIADDFGPTEIAPSTHYLFENPLPDPSVRGTPLTFEAPGTLVITSYELWHRATFNRADSGRPCFMLKFMAGALSEPAAGSPSWASVTRGGATWAAHEPAHALRAAHEQAWRWHLGASTTSPAERGGGGGGGGGGGAASSSAGGGAGDAGCASGPIALSSGGCHGRQWWLEHQTVLPSASRSCRSPVPPRTRRTAPGVPAATSTSSMM